MLTDLILIYHSREFHTKKTKPKVTQLIFIFLTWKNTINIENDVKAFKQRCTESKETK